ncbi:hypothetical protein C8E97_2252 [Saccharothrix australiensis]|uniref:Uncharacterized protein n=1 Tax=Saccharothrix australiensis TaxID=2072 RepID=A0A495VYL7_9PSEU|nr:hypothetical protein C8E97_2252 [Saccharothrix australiensis]
MDWIALITAALGTITAGLELARVVRRERRDDE